MIIKKRLEWIDALRGFTMFLVVFGHMLAKEGIPAYGDVLSRTFTAFRMPMFFFISGFIAYKSWEFWNGRFFIKRLLNKAKVQLIPTAIFFTLFCLVHYINPISFFSNGLGGYWFTFVLFEMFCIYFTVSFFSRFIHGRFFNTIMILIGCLGVFILVRFRGGGALWDVFCIENLTKYFQFFVFGLLAKKYKDIFYKCLGNDRLFTFSIIVFVSCLFIICLTDDFRTQYGVIGSFVHDILVRYAGVMVVLSLFYQNRKFFEEDSKIKNIMCFVGRRTLDIYMIHYFLLPNIPMMKDFFDGNIIIEFLFTSIMALVVLTCCLAISSILRNSSILKEYLFGVKS